MSAELREAMASVLAPVFAAVPWVYLIVMVVQVGRWQRWMTETLVIGLVSVAITVAWANHPIGWMGYGLGMVLHGPRSISSRVGTAYEQLVAMPGGDRHTVACLSKTRWYVRGALPMSVLLAIVVGAPNAVAQLAITETWSRLYRRARSLR